MKIYEIPSVAVLMSSYNGEKFIEEQIESILNQKNVRVELFIRDDGSTDDTITILQKYKSNKCIHITIGEENVGPANGFMQLLYHIDGFDYYSFADQDDIWLENKLFMAIEMIKEYKAPALYCSNQIIYKNGKQCGLRYKEKLNLSLITTLFSNPVSGCTMVLNTALASALRQNESRPRRKVLAMRMHDTWVITAAYSIGTVIYDSNGYILYRVHENNTVGIKNDDMSIVSRLKLVAIAFKNKQNLSYRSVYAAELLRCFPGLKDGEKPKLELLATYKKSIKAKVSLLRDKKIQIESGENRIAYKAKILMNIV